MFDLNKKEKPFTSFGGFGGGGLGLAGGAISAKTYVDDVFSTYLYEGNGTSQTINNGIDLSGEGGLVWIKNREISASDHIFTDTERGTNTILESNRARAAQSKTDMITSFTSTGFAVADNGNVNENNDGHCSWTFRKAEGFFDVVTYTGNNTAGRTVAHNLGSVPGMIVVKCLNDTEGWHVYHRSIGATKYLLLNSTNGENSGSTVWNNTTPTSTHFTVSTNPATNGNGLNYVAYVFAHDDQSFGTDEDESIIKCGSYTATGSAQTIDLGFEPQLLITKKSSGTGEWRINDTMRGIVSGGADAQLNADSNAAEVTGNVTCDLTATGFITNGSQNDSGATYIYMAIRRPNKPPEAAINVFSVNTTTNDNNFNTTGFPVDFAIAVNTNHTYGNSIGSRLQGQNPMFTNTSASQAGWLTANTWTSNTSFRFAYAGNGYNYANYAFKRTPGFMDVVTYTGTGSAQAINHNLGVVPELMLVKSRSNGESWMVYANGVGPTETLKLNNEQAASNFSNRWNGAPTSSVINISTDTSVGANNYTYVAYLFATLSGVSKVGLFTGTGNAINVDCGFTAGARFILIKRTDADADWYVWDSERGIVAGNDPYSLLNANSAQVTNTDYVDPLSTGFTVTSSAPAALNASGGTYLFLAIA